MKYEQPFGATDTNASYINGNPSTGTMGSIPPAASIENPQREIVNLITDVGMTPTDADLHQLGKGIQGGRLIYAVDFGIPNSYLINVVPALTAYAAGQRWNVKVLNTNTGSSTININSVGPRAIVAKDGQALKGGEMTAGAVVGLVDDGVHLQLQGVGSFGAFLTSNKYYYCNATTGDDTLYDGTVPTVTAGTAHGPFRTVQRAINAVLSWNMNGWGAVIYIADGVYPPFVCSALNGAGGCTIQGNNTTPANVLIQAATGEAIFITAPGWSIFGVKVTSGGNGVLPHMGDGIRLFGGAIVGVNYIEFGFCFHAHVSVQSTSTLILSGPMNGDSANSFINVSGNAQYHMLCFQNSFIDVAGYKLNVTAPVSIGVWAYAMDLSVIGGSYGTMTGSGNVTGQKYTGITNGVINTNGSGVNYFPGTAAGATASGGQYS